MRENLLVAVIAARRWSPLLDAVGMRSLADARPPELSHGQRRLVGVARALAARPKVLLLDEPAAGLDPSETAALAAVLRALPAQGIGVLLVDHDMTLVLDVCDELTALDLGRVIASGPTESVRDDPAVVAAYLGGAS